MKRLAWSAALIVVPLLLAARELPRVGDPNSPAARHVSPRYIEDAERETGARNMVTAVLADYRGFDTLGETVVVFTAGLACVWILLSLFTLAEPRPTATRDFGSPVLDVSVRLMTPFLLLFSAYVLVHGHDSPGGGFQGGAVFAGALILVSLVHGRDTAWRLSARSAVALAGIGTLIFAGVGFAALSHGEAFLDYGAVPLPGAPAARRALATLIIETGVFIAVAGVLLLIFYALSDRVEEDAS